MSPEPRASRPTYVSKHRQATWEPDRVSVTTQATPLVFWPGPSHCPVFCANFITYIFKRLRDCNSNSYRFNGWLDQNESVWFLSTPLMPVSEFLRILSTKIRIAFSYTSNRPRPKLVQFLKNPSDCQNKRYSFYLRLSTCRKVPVLLGL